MALSFFGKKKPDSSSSDEIGQDEPRGPAPAAMRQEFTDVIGGLRKASMAIKVSEGGGAVSEEGSVVEEATILHASGNSEAARACLEKAIDAMPESDTSKTLWYMLLDLYRIMGDYEAFEARAVQFVQRFEISPPAWDMGTSIPTQPAPAKKSGTLLIALNGNLQGSSNEQIDKIITTGTKLPKIRIDLSRLKSIDDEGCGAFLNALQELKRANTKVTLLGVKGALNIVQQRVKSSQRSDQNSWLFVLAMMQQMGEQTPFENMALDYAVTFEESPPSWDPPSDQEDLTDTSVHLLQQEDLSESFVFEGVITGQPDLFNQLAKFAVDKDVVNIDARNLQRMEFVSAGVLFNQLAQLSTRGKRIVIHQPNAMVAALMRVMGIDQIAQIESKNV